tara:strand:+ start:302 stop:499 length:198 start_codon:yes stop_codon:yes gene_type:complete
VVAVVEVVQEDQQVQVVLAVVEQEELDNPLIQHMELLELLTQEVVLVEVVIIVQVVLLHQQEDQE